jgi:hypothetical protein
MERDVLRHVPNLFLFRAGRQGQSDDEYVKDIRIVVYRFDFMVLFGGLSAKPGHLSLGVVG